MMDIEGNEEVFFEFLVLQEVYSDLREEFSHFFFKVFLNSISVDFSYFYVKPVIIPLYSLYSMISKLSIVSMSLVVY